MNMVGRQAAIYFTSLVIIASYFNIIQILYNDIAAGGGSYAQGDWLVNFSSGWVRRGALGEIILYFSDTFDLSPLYVVGAFQVILMTLVYASVVSIFYRVRHLKYGFALLLLPTFVLFWFYEGNAYYKEVIGMASFAPILIAAAMAKRHGGVKIDSKKAIFPLLASSFLFAMSVAGSEINIFFFPFLAFIAFSLFDRKVAIFYSGFIGACAFASALFTIQFPLVSSVDAMCNALLVRGLSQEICNGSIAWLARDSSAGLSAVLSMASPSHVFRTLLAVAISLGLIYFVLRVNNFHRTLTFIICLSFFIFSPLYLVAVDWGRWINMGIYGVVSLASIAQMSALQYGKEGERPFDSENWKYTLLLVIICSVWAITNRGTLMIGGALAFKFF